MSTRQMAQRYSGGQHSGGGGGSGIAGLIDMFMEPKRVKQQQGFEEHMTEVINTYQKELMDKEQKHAEDLKKLDDALKNNDVVREHAKTLGISPDQFVGKLKETAGARAQSELSNRAAAEASPEVAAMTKRNRLATMAQPEVANAKMLEMQVPEGGTGIQPQVPGITGNPTQLFGANKQATTVPTKSIPQMDKKGNITGMIPYENAVAQTTTSGKVIQPQPDVDLSTELNNKKMSTMPPNMGFNVNDPSNSGFAMSQLLHQQPPVTPQQTTPPQRMSPIPNNQSSLPPQGGDIIQELMKFLASPRASGNPPPFMNQGF